MRSARTITLFSERAEVGQGPSSYVVSVLAHILLICLVYFGIVYGPKVRNPILAQRYTLRHVDMNMPEELIRHSGGSGIAYPGPHSASAHNAQPGQKPDAQQAAFRRIVNAAKARQTVVQPDLPPLFKPTIEIPIPALAIWSSHKTPPPAIVPPPPAKPTAAEVQPTMVRPNEEVKLADVAIPAATLPSPKLPVLPSTTSPVVVHGPELPQQAPATVSVATAPPTPAAVLSLSDVRMPKGTVVLPPVNQSAASDSTGTLEPAQKTGKGSAAPANAKSAATAGAADAGQGAGNSKGQTHSTGAAAKTGEGQGAGDAKGQTHSAAGAGKSGPGQGAGDSKGQPGATGAVAGNGNGGKAGSGQGAGQDSGWDNRPGVHHLMLPKDGQFGSVVVGASLEDKYPESAGAWGGRLAYTVYLRVGQAKNWILQYALPHSADAASAGNAGRLDAPWPFNEVVPVSATGEIDTDALMIHGFVNQAGRFEGLTIVFPPDFPQAKFVLEALQQWQFRPAMRDGQPVRVEVLLIVPDESE